MAQIEMPQLGETVTEGTITRWFKSVGDTVSQDEVLFEVSTDKVDSEVPSPASGTITEILVPEGETVDVGTVIAVVSDGAEAPAEPPADTAPKAAPEPAPAPEPAAQPAAAEPAAPPPPPEATRAAPPSPPPAPAAEPAPQPAAAESDAPSRTEGKVLSPVVRRLINEYGIDPDQVEGSGLGGRISRDDVQRHIEANHLSPVGGDQAAAAPAAEPAPAPATAAPPSPQPAAAQAAPAQQAPAQQAPAPAPAPQPSSAPVPASQVQAGIRDVVVPLSNIRLRTGEHMVMSKSVAPHTLTAMEIDYEGVEQVRKANGAEFKSQEGFSLTYLPFISRATIDALREYPHLNASVGDRELIVHNYVNLAVAVDLDFQGLLAPVVRDADGKRMRAIARDISDLARRARSKQLSPDELSGGTFTLTNAGGYGTMMQFPIINQPQVAILSTDAVKRKPVVIDDEYGNESIAIHSVGVLALAWDHRAVDGAYAAAFMARVKEIIETRDWSTEIA
ncbi:MAG: 2-oxo acid dehydrogenase subunit E2 [Acidimicrobiia bacterium]|nr:2-oxo acid dehydrogenase subunit E2 [Acidimicrobiia bacterium]